MWRGVGRDVWAARVPHARIRLPNLGRHPYDVPRGVMARCGRRFTSRMNLEEVRQAMSALPPDASNTPQPADSEPEDPAAVPRWAVPAVPPPWADASQAASDATPDADTIIDATRVQPTPAQPTPAQPTPAQPAPWQPAPAQAVPTPAQAAHAPNQPAFPPTPAGPPPWAQSAPAAQPSWAQPGTAAPQPTQPFHGRPVQPYPQPGWVQPAVAPIAARKPMFERRKWLPTAAVAIVIAAVVLGGIGLDTVIAAPSAGTVNVGGTVTIKAAPGWVRVDSGGGQTGVVLQNANVRLTVAAEQFTGTASDRLQAEEAALKSADVQVSFGDEQDGTISGHEAAMAGFEAMVSGSSGSGTVEGEIICLIDAGNVVDFIVVTGQGNLGGAADDIKAMTKSVEVGQ